MKRLFGILLFLLSANSMAATVSPTSSAYFAFDVSDHTDIDIGGFNFHTGGVNKLASGASMNLEFGSTIDNNDLGGYIFTNTNFFGISGAGRSFDPRISIGSPSTLYIAVNYIDDIFSINTLGISLYYKDIFLESISGTEVSTPSPVPAPAAVWLFGSALGFMGLRRKAKNSAA